MVSFGFSWLGQSLLMYMNYFHMHNVLAPCLLENFNNMHDTVNNQLLGNLHNFAM